MTNQEKIEAAILKEANEYNSKKLKAESFLYAKNLHTINFIDPKEMVALHSVNLIVGRGSVFTAEDSKIKQWVDELLERNHFDYILKRIIYFLSYYGRAILTINRTAETNEYMIDLVEPSFFAEIGTITWEPQGAVIWKKSKVDSTTYWVKELWTTTEVKRYLYDESRNKEIRLQSLTAKIPKKFQLTKGYKHNLGFVPIVEFLNKPWQRSIFTSIQKTYNIEAMEDDYPVREMKQMINHTARQLYKAYLFNMPRIVGAFSGKTIAELKKGKSEMAFMGSDFFMFAGSGISSDGRTEGIDIMKPASNFFDEMLTTWNKQLDIYYEGCGYSRESGMKVDSATSALYSHSRDIQTTRSKVRYLHEKLNELFRKLLLSAKLIKPNYDRAKPPFAFEIIENTQISELEETNLIILQKQNLMISETEAIARARGISKQDAEVIFQEIIKQRKLTQSLGLDPATAQPDNQAQPGQKHQLKDQRKVAKEKGEKKNASVQKTPTNNQN